MARIVKLQCVKCGRSFSAGEALYTCSTCGIDGILDVVLDYDEIKGKLTAASLKQNMDRSIWRYLPAIPLMDTRGISDLQVGWTPLYNFRQLRAETGLEHLYIKDDSRNPTASLKDRASAVGVAKAIELNRSVMCAASTGNAASSLAGFTAAAGIKTYIFVPETAPEAKVTQLLIYGARVFLVKGTYDQAFELCFQASEAFGWYNRSCAVNPYLVEGKKTAAYEICEQLNWEVPDLVVVAVGDGCTIAGIWKGFKECLQLGLTHGLPKMIGIQASGANPVTRAFARNSCQFDYILPKTIADSISVGIPRNGIKALRAVQESGGWMLDVTDGEILEAMRLLAQKTGVFGEPAGVASFAGVIKMNRLGKFSGHPSVVSLVSGSGLKDIRSAALATGKAFDIDPSLDLVKKILKQEEQS